MKHSWSRLLFVALGIACVALADRAGAQQAAPAKSGTRLITLGTRSGPTPTVGRAQSSNLLIVNGALYVVDAGDGVTRRLTRLGVNFRDIGDIFITHPHSDHTSGLAALLTVIYDANRTSPVNVYGPPGTEADMRGLLAYLNVNSEVRISDGTKVVPAARIFAGHDLSVGPVLQAANVKVTAVENTHFHFPPESPGYGKYKSYAYRFDTPDRAIVFTGDTGPSEAIAELAKGADMLVSEVTGPIDEYRAQQIKIGRWQTLTPEQQAGSLRHMMEEDARRGRQDGGARRRQDGGADASAGDGRSGGGLPAFRRADQTAVLRAGAGGEGFDGVLKTDGFLRRVCKIECTTSTTSHDLTDDFAHAVGHRVRLTACAKSRNVMPHRNAAPGDFAHPTSTLRRCGR
jgi:ribonuclease BN (tRNA processing enzyme)